MPTQEAQERFAAIAKALGAEEGVSVGQDGKKGFGSSALRINGRIFAMVSSRGCLVFKLPKARVQALEASGAGQKFDPGHGRLMKEWLELSPQFSGWLALSREALAFVGSQA
jgi:hypothetical protein